MNRSIRAWPASETRSCLRLWLLSKGCSAVLRDSPYAAPTRRNRICNSADPLSRSSRRTRKPQARAPLLDPPFRVRKARHLYRCFGCYRVKGTSSRRGYLPLKGTGLSRRTAPRTLLRFTGVGSEVAHRGSPTLATVRRSNRACSFPAHGFHEDSRFRDAIEGIN